MFEVSKVGDRVCDIKYRWGTIIEKDNNFIYVKFDIHKNYDKTFLYSFDGKEDGYLLNCFGQTLFWDDVKFKIPEKPFDLEAELRKLEIKEFVNDEMNYYLYWSNPFEKIKIDYTMAVEIPLVKYFLEDET